MKTFRPLNLISVVCNSGTWQGLYRATGCAMVVSTSPQCKPLQTTLMTNEVQRLKSFHTAVVQYYSVVGHSPSLLIIILLTIVIYIPEAEKG